jgi:ribonuclease HI
MPPLANNTMATDGSEKGNMGAGCIGLNDNALRHHVQIGRAEEGAGSNRPETGALAEALRIPPRDSPLFLFSDSEQTLDTILKWVGEGSRVALHHCADGCNLAAKAKQDILNCRG